MLEVGMAEEVESQIPLDVDLMRRLVSTVQEHAVDLSHELRHVPAGYATQSQMQAAVSYAEAAADAYRAFLQRIDTATERLKSRDQSPDSEIVEAVTTMLADPRVQDIDNLHPDSP